MTTCRLDLVLDESGGAALWGTQSVAEGRSRILEDLEPIAEAAPETLREVLSSLAGPLRHRVAHPRTARRVPARRLTGTALVELMDALDRHLHQYRGSGGVPAAERLAELVEQRASARIGEALVAGQGLLRAALTDRAARTLVTARHVIPQVSEQGEAAMLMWRPVGAGGEPLTDPLLTVLVDARARRELDALNAGEDVADPSGVLAALGTEEAELGADIPARRRIDRALRAFADSARARVHLRSTELDLVVRLHEPPLGTGWPLQTCLRERDGTVHPVADLRAVGDLTAAAAAEAAGTVLRLAPTVRTAALEDTGVDWLLTTAEASTFLTQDADLLHDAGVTVMLPRDWTRVRASVRAEVTDASTTPNGPSVGLAAMMSFRWTVAVGDVELSEAEIAEIREAQSELVRLRGQWVRLDPATLRAAERFLGAFRGRGGRGRAAAGDDGAHGPADAAPAAAAAAAARSDIGARPDAGARPGAARAPVWELPGSVDPTDPVGPGAPSLMSGPGSGPASRTSARPGTASGALGTEPSGTMGASADLSLRDFFALLASEDAEGVDLADLSVHGEMARLLEAHTQAPELPAPRTLQAQLRPYQRRGLDWMWFLDQHELGGILADDMGLGKTMQVLALLCREREAATEAFADRAPADQTPADRAHGEQAPADRAPSDQPRADRALPRIGPTLLVCPMSVVGSWQREAERFAPHLAVHVHHGQDRFRDATFLEGAGEMDLVLTTYALLARDLPLLQRIPWHRVVLDEAQHVKNPHTAVSRAARALPASRRLALTGTPVENRLADLHSLMEVTNPGLLGPAARFQERLAGPIEKEADPAALSRLTRLTGPFVLRRLKTDRAIISDLPEKSEMTASVSLTPEQAGLYEALVAETLVQIDGADQNRRRAVVGAALTRLKQVCNHPAHYLGDGSAILREGAHRSGKLELVDDLLETAFSEGEKVLLFTQFTSFGHMLIPYWAERFDLTVPFLHGGVAKAERDAMVADFQARRDEPGAMLLSLRAGGTGLTLTAANHVVHLDRWWNPAVENQATDRAFRIGQTRGVQVRKLVSTGTVEERIDQVLREKKELAELAVSAGEGWIASLGDDELSELLTLDPTQQAPGATDGEGR